MGKWKQGKALESTHANLPAVCFVTAAVIPPLSLACFFSFFAIGDRVMVSSLLLLYW